MVYLREFTQLFLPARVRSAGAENAGSWLQAAPGGSVELAVDGFVTKPGSEPVVREKGRREDGI